MMQRNEWATLATTIAGTGTYHLAGDRLLTSMSTPANDACECKDAAEQIAI